MSRAKRGKPHRRTREERIAERVKRTTGGSTLPFHPSQIRTVKANRRKFMKQLEAGEFKVTEVTEDAATPPAEREPEPVTPSTPRERTPKK